jgi:adenosine deaminase
MSLHNFIRQMPKVELHVHLTGAVTPDLLLKLAQRNKITLPATTPDEMRRWFQFRDFAHFIEIYLTASSCIRTVDDLEEITRHFLARQAQENIRYTEFTHTAYTHYRQAGLLFADQLAALNRARRWARHAFGIDSGIVIDIPRVIPEDEAIMIADWAIAGASDGVVALGLGGPEVGNPPERYTSAFARARAAGLPSVPHAGETEGAASIWGALKSLRASRIGHGIRCLEDPALVAALIDQGVVLEVCPTSNVCVAGVPSLPRHPVSAMLDAGLAVCINTDDPGMFDVTLTEEFIKLVDAFAFDARTIETMILEALEASFLPTAEKQQYRSAFRAEFSELRRRCGIL